MELKVIGDGVNLNRQKERERVYYVKEFYYRCSQYPRPLLVLVLNVGQAASNESLKFMLNKGKTLSLVPIIEYPHIYEVCWKLGKLKYALKVQKLNIISKFEQHF